MFWQVERQPTSGSGKQALEGSSTDRTQRIKRSERRGERGGPDGAGGIEGLIYRNVLISISLKDWCEEQRRRQFRKHTQHTHTLNHSLTCSFNLIHSTLHANIDSLL